MALNLHNKAKIPAKVLELATHELPILRNKLTQIMQDYDQTLQQVAYYETIIEQSQLSIFDVMSGDKNSSAYREKADDDLKEYLRLNTLSDKILFITEFPEKFERKLIHGSGDIIEAIYTVEKKDSSIENEKLITSLKQSIPSTVSRLYKDNLLLKYRYKGTKGKFVTINSNWVSNGELKEQHKDLADKIELVTDEGGIINNWIFSTGLLNNNTQISEPKLNWLRLDDNKK
jgi:hypothetical protein